jgi:hypothetical protein
MMAIQPGYQGTYMHKMRHRLGDTGMGIIALDAGSFTRDHFLPAQVGDIAAYSRSTENLSFGFRLGLFTMVRRGCRLQHPAYCHVALWELERSVPTARPHEVEDCGLRKRLD